MSFIDKTAENMRKIMAERDELRAELAQARVRIKELEEEKVEDLGCIIRGRGFADENGVYDSMALSDVCDAMQQLAEMGRFEITDPGHGRRCFGKFKAAPQPDHLTEAERDEIARMRGHR